ncbi:MAG: MATE family efflux transporter [Treponema sp.]|nr:MATE family efflux transporter [Treponema sp.]
MQPAAERVEVLTSGSPVKRISLFALPFFAGDLFHVLYTMIDAYIISRALGLQGLAAVGASQGLAWLIYSLCFGLSDGFTVICAQRVGAHDSDGVRRSVAASIILGALVSLCFTLILIPLVPALLGLMRTPLEIMAPSVIYVTIAYGGLSFVLFSNLLSGFIRAGGNSLSPMIFFIIATVCKVALSILFVMVFSWGVGGAALATVLADLLSSLLALLCLIRRYPQFIPRKADWRSSLQDLGVHFSLGLSMAMMRFIIEIGAIFVQAAINGLGSLTIAAVSAAQRIRGLCIIPFFSLSRAMTTYTAQNYGAARIDRVYKGLFQLSLLSLGLGFIIAGLNHFFVGPLVSVLLPGNPEAIGLAVQYLRINGYFVSYLGILLSFRSCLQGLGQKSATVLCGIAETLSCTLFAFVLIPRLGLNALYLTSPFGWIASSVPLFIAFGIIKKKNLFA